MLDKTKRYLIVGLGLLGGKYALELSKAGFHVDGINRSEGHLQYALDHGYIETGKTHDFEDLVSQADHIIFGLYPTALIDWFKTYGHLIKPGCIFTDVSGVKTGLVEPVQAMCPEGVEFIASHPMAGREVGGYDNSLDNLFDNASFICTPYEDTPKNKVDALLGLAEDMHFARTVVTTPEHHDEMIAFTSQIAHVLACSYVLSPLAPMHSGYSAGSYRDVSRVARINADMWADLFIDNKKALVAEIDDLVSNLMKFKYNIVNDDTEQLKVLMNKANKIKEEIG
mgnify:CR=1 FL=1